MRKKPLYHALKVCRFVIPFITRNQAKYLELVRLCITLSCVKKYVMEPNVFLGYLGRGIVMRPNEGIVV
jgi:hypothetical protein